MDPGRSEEAQRPNAGREWVIDSPDPFELARLVVAHLKAERLQGLVRFGDRIGQAGARRDDEASSRFHIALQIGGSAIPEVLRAAIGQQDGVVALSEGSASLIWRQRCQINPKRSEEHTS